MDLAISLPTKANSWEVAKRAEELGYTHAWFYDTELLNAEVFAAMAVAAVKTSKIKLCAGVLIPSNRIAPVAASGLATLNALAPGRIVFGASTGFTARRTLGLGPVTRARLRKYVLVVEALLRGETVDWDEEGGVHKIKFLNPEMGIINTKDPIPTFISAFGPKARELTAELGAGWIGSASFPAREKETMTHMQTAWKNKGHDPKALYSVLGTGGCVLAEGESADGPRARAQAGPYAAIIFHNVVEQEQFGSVFDKNKANQFPFPEELDAYRKVYLGYEPADARYLSNHRGHLMFLRPEEKHITGKVISGFTLTGTQSELVDRLRGIKEAGYSQIQFHTVPGQENDMLEKWAEVMSKV